MADDSVNISELPEYGPAYAEYRAGRRAADESDNPELERLKVEHRWSERKNELMGIAVGRQAADTRRKDALAAAAKDFPDAPATAYQHLTDPEQILATAKQVHEGINAKLTETQQSWGAPTAVGQGAQGGETSDDRLRALVPDVERGNVDANERYRREVFKERVGSRFDFSKTPGRR